MIPFTMTRHGLFEVFIVLVIFPLVVMAGAGETIVTGLTGKLCRLSGRLSYPVYMIHCTFIFLFAHWVGSHHPSQVLFWSVGIATYIGVVFLAWLLLTFYDEPLRNRLSSWTSGAIQNHGGP